MMMMKEYDWGNFNLSVNSILLLPEKPQIVMAKIPQLFKVLMVLVKKNADERIDEGGNTREKGQYNVVDEDEEDFDNFNY